MENARRYAYVCVVNAVKILEGKDPKYGILQDVYWDDKEAYRKCNEMSVRMLTAVAARRKP